MSSSSSSISSNTYEYKSYHGFMSTAPTTMCKNHLVPVLMGDEMEKYLSSSLESHSSDYAISYVTMEEENVINNETDESQERTDALVQQLSKTTTPPSSRLCLIEKEPLLTEDTATRYCLYPIVYPDIFKFYKDHQHILWTAEEVDFSADKNDWDFKLNKEERYFIEHILAFFAGSDGIVLENLVSNFCTEVKIPEVRCFYTFQAMMENVHSEVYSLMIDTFITEEERKQELFHAIYRIPCVQQKAEWALQWISKSNSFATRLLAFATVEGLFFSGSFCSIFWLKERGLMTHSLGKSNEWIARDEGLHMNFAIYLYNHYIVNKVSSEIVHSMIRNAVKIETEFLTESLPVRLIGMNHELMIQYIQFVADRLLSDLQYDKLYHVSNPFPFMEKMGLDGKTNFFEQRVSEYTLGNDTQFSSHSFNMEDEF